MEYRISGVGNGLVYVILIKIGRLVLRFIWYDVYGRGSKRMGKSSGWCKG